MRNFTSYLVLTQGCKEAGGQNERGWRPVRGAALCLRPQRGALPPPDSPPACRLPVRPAPPEPTCKLQADSSRDSLFIKLWHHRQLRSTPVAKKHFVKLCNF